MENKMLTYTGKKLTEVSERSKRHDLQGFKGRELIDDKNN